MNDTITPDFTYAEWQQELESTFMSTRLEPGELTLGMIVDQFQVSWSTASRKMAVLVKEGSWTKRKIKYNGHIATAYRKVQADAQSDNETKGDAHVSLQDV